MAAFYEAAGDKPKGARVRAFAAIMYGCGPRTAEATAILPGDVSNRKWELFIREGKGGTQRTVPMPKSTWQWVKRWMTVRSEMLAGFPSIDPDKCPLLCTMPKPFGGAIMPGRRMHRANAYRDIQRVAQYVKTRDGFHPHGFRHTYAVDLHKAGASVEEIRRMLGHKSLDNTKIYLEGLPDDDVLASVRGKQESKRDFDFFY